MKDGKALGTVPRRHPHFPQLNAWFRSLRSEGSWARVPASELAVSIALLMDELEIPNHLPPEWGFSFFWRPRSGLFKKPGLQSVQAAASPIVQAILDSALAAGLGCVDLTLAMPYPYSCLEPVAEELLGRGREDARRWLAEKLEGGAGALTESVAGLLRQAGRGVAVWPGHRLDQASREVLADAALRAGRTALVLERDGDAAGGTLSRLRWLWLPETAEKWYMRHAGELYRDRLEKLVAAVSSLPPGEPRCGRPLIPPALPSAPKSPARQKWFNPWVWETHSPCRAWSASSYLAASNQPEGAAFLKGMALLRAGQASLALDAWRDLTDPPVAAEHLAVQRERALERLQAYETILEQPESDRLSSLAGRDRTAHLFLAGQSAWILGETAQGRKTLEEGLASSTRADEQAQGHCHLATLDLYQGQIASAEERLREAEEHLPSKPEPLTLFLLHHRRGWVQRSRGDFESALSHFRAAGSAARKGGDCRLEAASEGEAGNVLRLMCRFEDALPALRRAEDGARALGLQEAAETARFNRIL
ncbi:MAG: tetratricopeptide repeat protein, partial [Acidobacteriota bacterium]